MKKRNNLKKALAGFVNSPAKLPGGYPAALRSDWVNEDHSSVHVEVRGPFITVDSDGDFWWREYENARIAFTVGKRFAAILKADGYHKVEGAEK